jgi:pyruvate dehydrogenase E2 component (dihydrolipoamide acetyltransferase)
MAQVEFRLPDIGEGLAEAEVVSWLVKPGDHVQENQPVAELETDKAIVTMPAPATGTVAELHAKAGDRVAVGSVLMILELADASSAVVAPVHEAATRASATRTAPPPVAPTGQREGPASPAARKVARELGVSLADVRGSGPGGRITVEDVHAHASRALAATSSADVQRIPVSGLRRRVAEAMTRAVRAIPHVCGFHELDATALTEAYERLKPMLAGQGVRLTYLSFIVKAVALALVDHPELNASYDESGPAIILNQHRNIGIATATPDGLLVPVIHDADHLDLAGIARETERLATGGRARTLERRELQDGTFTISNVGQAGGWFGTSIIRYPEAAILGVGRIEPRAVVRDGTVVVRQILPLSLTFDHRIIDGDAALAFVQTIRRLLELTDSPVYSVALTPAGSSSMTQLDPTCVLFVQMTVKKDEAAAFNTWYETEYIPAFVREVPGITKCRRFVTLSPDGQGVHTYLTIYEFTDEAAITRGMEVMKSREGWRKAWKEWEQRAVASIADGLYRTTTNISLQTQG